MSPRTLVGLDLGGTKLRGAIADEAGALFGELLEPTLQGAASEMIDQMVAMVRRLATDATATVDAVGVAVGAAPDPGTGRLDSVANMPGLRGVALAHELERELGIPIVVENDANLAALAEGSSGVAAGIRDYIVIALGTGIGVGIVSDGQLLHGWRGMAGEVAFLPLGGKPGSAAAERVGTYESAVGGAAVQSRIEAASTVAGAIRRDGTLREIIELAASGDPAAVAIVRSEAEFLALGIDAMVAVLDPELVVLAGGVGAIPGFLGPVRRAVAARLSSPPRIETTALGERGVVLGALEAARTAKSGPRI